MPQRSWSWFAAVLFVGILGLLGTRSEVHTVRANAAAANAGWEYQTASVELGSLSTKLNDLGKDSWDVVMIIPTDSVVDNGPDGKPHVLVQRVEVTAKRPK